MAILRDIIFCAIMMYVVCVHCSPIKRSAKNQQATDCYGTDVNFPENVSDMVMTFIPEMIKRHEQQIQNMTAIMNNMATSVSQLLQSQLTVLSERLPVPLPKDCQDVARTGISHQSGVYTIYPQDGHGSFQVYCDMETNGVAWTIFQKRFDGSIEFFLEWSEYVSGFGNIDGEYWLGLSHIHRMTRSGLWQLRIDLEAFDGDTAYALYESFIIGDAASNYRLHIGEYSGTAGRSMRRHNNMDFCTNDKDNDAWSERHCAQLKTGAWWYGDCAFANNANLNGLYLGPSSGRNFTGIVWYYFKEFKSLKMTEMKMRRVG